MKKIVRFALLLASFALLFACTTRLDDKPVSAPKAVPKANDNDRMVSRAGFISDYESWQTLGSVSSWKLAGNQAEFLLSGGQKVLVSFCADNVYRLRFNPEGDYSKDNSYAVVNRGTGPTSLKTSESAEYVELATPVLTVRVAKASCMLTALRDGKIIASDAKPLMTAGSRVVARRHIGDADKFYGFGEKAGPLLKNGESMKMWNTDAYGYTKRTDPLYMTIPFFMNAARSDSWGILFDNTWQSFFDVGREVKDELYFGASGGEMDYYFISAADPSGVLRTYASLTGTARLPPEWALGYQQSRYSYMTETEVMTLANNFRDRKIPADVLYLDIDYMNGNRSFTNNEAAFPDPSAMLARLKALGFKAVTIIDPGIKVESGYPVYDSGLAADVYLKDKSGNPAQGQVWPGTCVFPDFGKKATDAWWGAQYKTPLDQGFAAIWNDMNEPAAFNSTNGTLPLNTVHTDFGEMSLHAKMHNVYGMLMAKATLEGMDALRPDARNFVLSRAGYAGSQRYAATWTGDNSASWEHLRLNVTMVLNLGLSGIPLSGADIGGYKGNPSPELFARWMQLGAFLPFYRNHTEKGATPHEPWAFGTDIENISRSAIELRYRLLPYYYGLARDASVSGDPLVRPLFYHYPMDGESYTVEDEFLIGDSILASPAVTQGAVSRDVFFPSGTTWYDWDSGEAFEGGKSYTVETPLEKIPLYARDGAIVPLRQLEQWVGEKKENPLTLRIWPGAAGEYILYQDDGATLAYKDGGYLETKFTCSPTQAGVTVTSESVHASSSCRPRSPWFSIQLELKTRPAGVVLDGRAMKIIEGTELSTSTVCVWESGTGRLFVRIPDWNQPHRVEVKR